MSSGDAPEGSAGFFYRFAIHMGLGRGPVNELIEARMGGKLGWQGSATSADPLHTIDSPALFGGPAKEGGIQGPFVLLNGDPGQDLTGSYMHAVLIAPSPATGFRRMCTVFYDGFIAALNPYPKPWSWRVRRSTSGWDGDVLRPDLAVIDLLGDPIAPVAGAARPIGEQRDMVTIPITNGVHTIATPPVGCEITDINYVIVSDDSAGNGNPTQPPFEWDLLPDGTAEIRTNINSENRYITAHFYYNNAVGTPGFVGSSVELGTVVPHKARIKVNPPAGCTVSATLSVTRRVLIGGGPFYTDEPIDYYALVSNEPGEAIYEVSPRYYLIDLKITFSYAGASSGTTMQENNVDILPNAPMVTLVPPGGGDVAEIQYIPVSFYVVESEFHTQPESRDIPYLLEGNDVTMYEVEQQGNQVPVVYNYFLNLGGGPITPIRDIKAMNPAHIIYEALTNREWGRGLDRSVIDSTSFEVAAQTLVDEGFGACGRWARRDSVASFVQGILDMIGATLYTNRSNALLTLFLIRGDYDRNALKLWDTSNGILEITDSTVNTATVVVNEIIVRYRDPVFNEDRTVNVQNLASLQSGAFNTKTVDYKFCPTSGLARRLAQRDLRSYAQGLRRFKITVDRRGYALFPGAVMRIQDVARKIPDMVVRVATMKDGILTDGKISMDVVQDVFSFPATSYVQGQPNTWAPPSNTPCIGEHEVFEAPFVVLRRRMSNADFAFLDDSSAYLATVADQGQTANVGYKVAVRDSAPTSDDIPLPADQLYCGYTP